MIEPEPAKRETKIDPDLEVHFSDGSSEPLDAAITFRSKLDTPWISSDEFEAEVERVLRRVTALVKQDPADSQILGNIGTLLIKAAPAFLEALVTQPEVLSAFGDKALEPIRPVQATPWTAPPIRARHRRHEPRGA
jgi:hypothetical protein